MRSRKPREIVRRDSRPLAQTTSETDGRRIPPPLLVRALNSRTAPRKFFHTDRNFRRCASGLRFRPPPHPPGARPLDLSTTPDRDRWSTRFWQHRWSLTPRATSCQKGAPRPLGHRWSLPQRSDQSQRLPSVVPTRVGSARSLRALENSGARC